MEWNESKDQKLHLRYQSLYIPSASLEVISAYKMSSLFGSGAASSSNGMGPLELFRSEADGTDMTARKEQMKQSIVQEVSIAISAGHSTSLDIG